MKCHFKTCNESEITSSKSLEIQIQLGNMAKILNVINLDEHEFRQGKSKGVPYIQAGEKSEK